MKFKVLVRIDQLKVERTRLYLPEDTQKYPNLPSMYSKFFPNLGFYEKYLSNRQQIQKEQFSTLTTELIHFLS